jgi:hypothetical protein
MQDHAPVLARFTWFCILLVTPTFWFLEMRANQESAVYALVAMDTDGSQSAQSNMDLLYV